MGLETLLFPSSFSFPFLRLVIGSCFWEAGEGGTCGGGGGVGCENKTHVVRTVWLSCLSIWEGGCRKWKKEGETGKISRRKVVVGVRRRGRL